MKQTKPQDPKLAAAVAAHLEDFRKEYEDAKWNRRIARTKAEIEALPIARGRSQRKSTSTPRTSAGLINEKSEEKQGEK